MKLKKERGKMNDRKEGKAKNEKGNDNNGNVERQREREVRKAKVNN